MPSRAGSFSRAPRWLLATVFVLVLGWLCWGPEFLVTNNALPAHVDAAVVLQGSVVAEKLRMDGAVRLLQQNMADRALISVPQESYWGQSIPPIARAYLEKTYGPDIAARIDFCETGEEVDSTTQEAGVLVPCIQERHWRSIVVVTSSYHTRRAGIIWKRTIKLDSDLHLWILGVNDPAFQPSWWRERIAAKTFVMESVKLFWTAFGG